MKVLMLNGSPHKEGTTFTALCEVEKTLNESGIETEIVWIKTKPLMSCMACGKCSDLGKCVFDDGVNEFVQKAQSADGFIFGSPTHYAAATGAITSFLGRAFYSNSSAFAFKPAAIVTSARRGGTTSVFDQLNKFMGISQMPIICTSYWNEVFGRNGEDAKEDLEGMQTMRQLGRNMAYFLKCIESGKKDGIEPEIEDKVFFNFIR